VENFFTTKRKMPFRSEAMRRYLWMYHPSIAKRWAHEYPKSNRRNAKGVKVPATRRRQTHIHLYLH
jgi:hypothetical protein